jgi:glycosyltransferase involved in cell wall biosynthesis
MIVFNGDEFLQQVLDSIYDFAYQIIIAEGADRNSLPFANPDGGSTDRTLEIIKNYPDPYGKIMLVQGVWKDKVEQSNAWIEKAAGDFVWQVDDDEIYKEEDLLRIDDLLTKQPETTAVSFHWCHFFGGMDRVRPNSEITPEVWRIFKFRHGYRWRSHRPPDILDEKGRSLRESSPIHADKLVDLGIYIYHFSYITDNQVREKMRYMERVRMIEYDIGMEANPLWRLYGHIKSATSRKQFLKPLKILVENYFQWWKHRPSAIKKRKKADRSWNYDFYEDIWLPWKKAPQEIEGRGILSANTGLYSVTEPFRGELPRAVLSHPLFTETNRKKNIPTGRAPNFFIAGAARSGTTALWHFLKQHPKVFMPTDEFYKEPAYFSVKGCGMSHDKYIDIFKKAGHCCERIGEASTAYLTDPMSAKKIHDFSPDAKIIIMLRNPVDRAYSLYHWMTQEGYEHAESFEQALELENVRIGKKIPNWFEPEYYWNYLYFHSGLYYRQVKNFLDLFGDNVCIVKTDDFENNFYPEYKKICKFLEVAPNEVSPRKYNKAYQAYSPLIQFILRKIIGNLADKKIDIRKVNQSVVLIHTIQYFLINSIIFHKGEKRLPDPLLTLLTFQKIVKLINKKNTSDSTSMKSLRDLILQVGFKTYQRKPLSPILRNALSKRYVEDIVKLEKLTNVNFSEWLQ